VIEWGVVIVGVTALSAVVWWLTVEQPWRRAARAPGDGSSPAVAAVEDWEAPPVYDVPLSYAEARAIATLLRRLRSRAVRPEDVVLGRDVLADALLYAVMLEARTARPRAVDDDA
jgi:hypothetical protein